MEVPGIENQEFETALLQLVTSREGHFQFESGHHGNLWLDLDALFLKSRSLAPFAVTLALRFAKHEVQLVCGPLVGGTLAALRAAGALPVVVAALLDLSESRTSPPTFDGLPLVLLATLPARLWTPSECPLCASGVPLERVVGD